MTLKARIRAIDRFVKGCREDGIYDDLNACCVMAGWDSLAGALTPLKGTAPTNSGLSSYDRGGIGITGDGTSYLNTNRLNSADGQEDKHLACFVTSPNLSSGESVIGSLVRSPSLSVSQMYVSTSAAISVSITYINSSTLNAPEYDGSAGLFGASRTGTDLTARVSGVSSTVSSVTNGNHALPTYVFCRNDAGTANSFCDGSIAFYSTGSATDLALLDARVSTLMADLRAIEEAGFDRDAIAYIRAVEEADGGAYLETDVKVAINNLVSGLKSDGLWDAMASSCLLCGPRTLAGALVPLKGDAPIAYNFASGDFDRIGLEGNATNTFINASRLNSASPQDDVHYAVYQSTPATTGILMGSGGAGSGANNLWEQNLIRTRCQSANIKSGSSVGSVAGFLGMNRSNSAFYDVRYGGVADSHTDASSEPGDTITTIFARGTTGGGRDSLSDAKISFYSIGTSLDLAKLDTHISDYVTAIGAAL